MSANVQKFHQNLRKNGIYDHFEVFPGTFPKYSNRSSNTCYEANLLVVDFRIRTIIILVDNWNSKFSQNKPGTAQVGAISKAQQIVKFGKKLIMLYEK